MTVVQAGKYWVRWEVAPPLKQFLAFWFVDQMWWACVTPPLLALGRRFRIDRKNAPRRLALHLAVALAIPPIHGLACMPFSALLGPMFAKLAAPSNGAWLASMYLGKLLVGLEIIAAAQGIAYYREFRRRELRAAQLEIQLARAQLQALQMQLQPHFLFNTLHAISTLVHERADDAERMLALLSDLLRATLERRETTVVSLGEELILVRRYLEIEAIRFQDRLAVVEDVSADCLDALVPSFLLQPLMENAVRHGIARCPGPGSLGLKAHRDAGLLDLVVWNTGPAGPGTPSVEGIGLANTRARLVQLYGHEQRLRVGPRAGGGTEVMIRLPYEPENAADAHSGRTA